ncbi:MAG TPA: isochorismatase family protein [Dehalococcoidia bacterium]|jgi:nicotinamidase-related amidase|nr:isochorismatase family protein [Dehalococcoidia bacterium]
MAEDHQETAEDYRRKGFMNRSGYGTKPALLVVDFIYGFTDPTTPLGGDFSKELAVTADLLETFRAAQLPIVYTTIAYEPGFEDGGVFVKKVPSLKILEVGSKMVDVDNRIRPRPDEYVALKKYASAFFNTDIDAYLKARSVDTIIMTGCTTSGCIRASAIDSMQYGYLTVVVEEGVGDRAQGPHDANLFDIDAKYGDVVSVDEVNSYMKSLATNQEVGAQVLEDFNKWWRQDANLNAKVDA